MSPRPSLPGADELFRTTSGPSVDVETIASIPPLPVVSAHEQQTAVPDAHDAPLRTRSTRRGPGDRSTSGRQRHEEKITVYVSGGELVDLERARLALRADHGLAVDRGRIVREALAVVLADLEAKGDDSILVRRLKGR